MSPSDSKAMPPAKRGLIAKVHVARRDLGLDDDTYRIVLVRVTGKASSRVCSIAELEAVIEDFRRSGWRPKARPPKRAGRRPLAEGAAAEKLRALWLSGHHLGVVDDPREEALSRFVKRVTGGRRRGVEALQWLDADGARRAVEALKGWLAREAGVRWGESPNPREDVVRAQWAILLDRGATPAAEPEDFGRQVSGERPFHEYQDGDWNRLVEQLGRLIRKT